MSATSTSSRKLALVMGVANHRSLAWACVEALLAREYDCILTYQGERFRNGVDKLVEKQKSTPAAGPCILGSLPCDVTTDLPLLFSDRLPDLLKDDDRKLDALVHSIAYADLSTSPTLSTTTWEVFQEAQHVSAYSLLQVAQLACANGSLVSSSASLTALTYLGATRAVPGYASMGPAKASLEALVRGLALEYGQYSATGMDGGQPNSGNDDSSSSSDDETRGTRSLRVNAVSAGPIATLSARGIAKFGTLQRHVVQHSPLQRAVTPDEVAQAVAFLASDQASGISGQVLHVDGGYSSVLPVRVDD